MKKVEKYYLKTYGCKMNYADSDRIRYMLDESGIKEIDTPEEADVIILNSCSVRQQSEDKVWGWVKKAELSEYSGKSFILTGCMAIRYDRKTGKKNLEYEAKLRKSLPWVTEFIDSADLEGMAKVLDLGNSANTNGKELIDDSYNLHSYNFNFDRWSGNIPISIGCDFFCTYCIVPFSRGDMVHRDLKLILEECQNFISKGGKIISLIGQNVNSWKGLRGNEVIGFPELLEEVCKLEGDFWVNFVSSNPMDFSEKLAEVVVSNPKVMKGLNLAVQSGSNEVLNRMNRHYTAERFLEIVRNLKGLCPDFNLSTDIIVGFPGETEEDFQKSLELVRTAKFSMIYIGKYSVRKGTVAAKFVDDVPLKVKREREQILRKELDQIKKSSNQNWEGKNIRVLLIGARRGISFYGHEVNFDKTFEESEIGSFIDCRVVSARTSGLVCVA